MVMAWGSAIGASVSTVPVVTVTAGYRGTLTVSAAYKGSVTVTASG